MLFRSTDTALIEQKQKYVELQQESILNSEKEQQAIGDLVKQGYQALIDSLSESVSKYKELLQNAKNAHDYQKNISQQTENISTLKKQINAYASMTDSEEVSAKLQQLKEELENAEEGLEETMYEKYLSDTQDALDDIIVGLEDLLEELSEDMEKLIETGTKLVSKESVDISTTLQNLSEKFETPLSNAMNSTWGSYGNAKGGIDAIIKAFQTLMDKTDQKNDKDAYKTASSVYQDYRSYNDDINAAKDKKEELKKKRENAEEKKDAAKEKLDKVKKKYGKDSKQYKDAYAAWEAAKQNYDTIDKKYQNSKQKIEDLRAQKEAAITANSPIVQTFLSSIADNDPSKPESKMDALDQAVYQITGGYITDANRKQIFDLLGVKNANQAVNVLQKLGLLGKQPVDKIKNHQEMTRNPDKNDTKITASKPGKIPKDPSRDNHTSIMQNGGKDSDSWQSTGPFPRNPDNKEFSRKPIQEEYDRTELYTNHSNSERINPMDYFAVITSFQEQALQNVRSSREELLTLLPSVTPQTGNLSISTGDLYLPGVTDPSEFAEGLVNALTQDTVVQKTLSTLINTRLIGGNSLSVRKYERR